MKDYVVESLERTGVTLLDTRTVEEYVGQLTSAPGTPQPDIYRKGRIPGAVHVAWDDGASPRRDVQVHSMSFVRCTLTPESRSRTR